jgi:enterochelin esterase family protein
MAACAPPRPSENAERVTSPEVSADGRITFRLRAPSAEQVVLHLEGATPTPMVRDSQGVWSLTTPPLGPDYYGYSFVANEVSVLDPGNGALKPNLLGTQNIVHIPGPGTLPWETADVPHGTVHRHFYRSAVVGDDRDFYVYTPPGYDPARPAPYPVVYLLHGFSDDASGWVAVGRANFILDNLIARGEALPMLVVMPLGYGAPEILAGGFAGFGKDHALRMRNFERFRAALLDEVIPAVESTYHAATDRRSRAIAGLSMGGAEALYVGLNDSDRFAWVGSFSAGGLTEPFDPYFLRLHGGKGKRLELFVSCGQDDHLIEIHRKLIAWLAAKGVPHVPQETSGAHTWMVWRRNLVTFTRSLFRTPDAP